MEINGNNPYDKVDRREKYVGPNAYLACTSVTHGFSIKSQKSFNCERAVVSMRVRRCPYLMQYRHREYGDFLKY